jgi:DNA-binding response OmpR family regulator
MRLLIVEDEKNTALTLRDAMKRQYSIDLVYSAAEAEYQASINEYDAILIDFNLPDSTGPHLCRSLRRNEVIAPILVLTGRTNIEDKVLALDAGADDYMTKPFNMAELQARLRALLRRHHPTTSSSELSIGDLVIDLTKNTVRREGHMILLRRKEFQLLEYLVRNRGRVVTRNMIVEHIWDNLSDPITNTVDVHVKYLRDQIDKPFPKKLIKTIYGMGYKIDS